MCCGSGALSPCDHCYWMCYSCCYSRKTTTNRYTTRYRQLCQIIFSQKLFESGKIIIFFHSNSIDSQIIIQMYFLAATLETFGKIAKKSDLLFVYILRIVYKVQNQNATNQINRSCVRANLTLLLWFWQMRSQASHSLQCRVYLFT